MKEKVRSLALQTKPSVPLILVTLDELARTARRKGHSEASMYEELSRQANLNQEKIDRYSKFLLKCFGWKSVLYCGKSAIYSHQDQTRDEINRDGENQF